MEFDDEEDDNPRRLNDIAESNPNSESPMVIIRDFPHHKNDLSIFPPINHENLHFSLSSSSSSSSLSFTSSFSPSDSDHSDPDEVPDRRRRRRWIGIGLEALRLRALRLVSPWLRGDGVVWWKTPGIAAVVVVVVWSCWIRARHRRRVEGLIAVVKSRDEKISRLLHQIAELNEVLITRHRVLASKVAN